MSEETKQIDVRGFGKPSLREVKRKLQDVGLSLRGEAIAKAEGGAT